MMFVGKFSPNRLSRTLRPLFGVCMLALGYPSFASVVVVTCTGNITNGGTDPSVFESVISSETPYAAVFNVEIIANDYWSGSPNSWDYYDHIRLNDAFITFGDYTLTPDPGSGALNSLAGTNDTGLDALTCESYNSAGNGLYAAWIHADLQDFTQTALTSKGLPPVGPGLNDITRWNSAHMTFMATNSASQHRSGWEGTITSIHTSTQPYAVPEPGSLTILGFAIPGMWTFRRRKNNA